MKWAGHVVRILKNFSSVNLHKSHFVDLGLYSRVIMN